MSIEHLLLFDQPRQLSERQRMLRGGMLRKALEFGFEGEHAYCMWAGIPIVRNILQAELYDARIYRNNTVSLRFHQYQQGNDQRFGVPNNEGWRDEVISVLDMQVLRKNSRWCLDMKFLKGESYNRAISDFEVVNRQNYSSFDSLSEEARREAIERIRFRVEERDRVIASILTDVTSL